jgi:hypothetical protein
VSTSALKPDIAGELPGRRVRFKTVFPGGRNTAEPSGELSVGDIVCVGEVPLAVGRTGWIPVRGGLTEVRTREHGTNPLPGPGRPPGGGTGAGQVPAVSACEEPGT